MVLTKIKQKTHTIIFLLIALSLTSFASSDFGLESSVVNLYIAKADELLIVNQFFEIIDKGEQILLPLISFSKYLGIELESINEDHIILLEFNERSLIYSVANNTFPDFPEWSDNAPIELDGVLYVSTSVFEYLTEARIEWKPIFQEVFVTLNFTPHWLNIDNQEDNISKNDIKEDKLLENFTATTTNSGITLIRYNLKSGYNISQKNSSIEGNWQLYGRLLGFSFNLNFGNSYSSSTSFETKLQTFRAKYENKGHRLIIGDEVSFWAGSLEKKYIRGLTYNYSYGPISNAIAYKSFSGEVTPLSTVSLYVNNKLLATLNSEATENGYFIFPIVPLLKMQLNYIRIVIKEPSGTFEEINYNVVGEPRIFLPRTYLIQAALGSYRSPDTQHFEGDLYALSFKLGGPSISFHGEGISLSPKTGNQNNALRFSLYFQPLNQMLLDANFYINPKPSNEYGASFTIKYFLPSIIASANYSKIPSSIAAIYPQRIGESTDFTLTILPMQNWRFELQKLDRFIDSTNTNQSRFSITVNKVMLNPANSLLGFTYFNEEINSGNSKPNFKVNGLKWGYRERTNTTHLERSFEFKQSTTSSIDHSSRQNQELIVNASGTEVIDKTYLISHSFIYQNQLDTGKVSKQSLNTTATVKGTIENITAYLSLSSQSGTSVSNLPNALNVNTFQFQDFRMRFVFDQFIRKNFHISSNTIRTWKKESAQDTFETQLSINYRLPKLVFTSNIEYLITLSNRNQNTLSTSIEVEKTFENGLSITPRLKLNTQLMSKHTSYYIGIDLNQAIGFSAKKLHFMAYSDENPKSHVTGRVFLDLNENGLYDKDEPLLPNIPVRLDNQIVETALDGTFTFEDLDPGDYLLDFDDYSLPADYNKLIDPKIVVLKEYDSVVIDLPLIIRGSISGVVFIDTNENGLFDDKDIPLSFGTILINGQQKTITDSSGLFLFDNLKLGKITLSLDPKSLPPQAAAKDITFTISHTKTEITNVLIPVQLQSDRHSAPAKQN